MELDPLPMEVVLKNQFEEWRKKTGNRNIELKEIDPKLFSMQLVMAGDIVLKLGYPCNKDEGMFFMESVLGNPSWVQPINDYITSRDSVEFAQVLDKIVEISKKTLKSSEDDIHASRGSDADDLEDEPEIEAFNTAQNFSVNHPEQIARLRKEVEKCQQSFGKDSCRLSEDSGQIIIRIDLHSLINESVAKSLDLLLDELLIITIDYARKSFANSDESAPTFSLSQRTNKSKRLKKNLIKELVQQFVEKNWNKNLITVDVHCNSSSNNKKPKTASSLLVIQLQEMGFDQSTCAAALSRYDNNFERALESILTGEFMVVISGVSEITEISYALVQETLRECNGQLEEAVEKLLKGGGNVETDLEKFRGKSLGFIEGLYVCIQNSLGNYTHYCCVCNAKHSCNRMSEKPVVCSQPLCMFRYEELGVGVKVRGYFGGVSKIKFDNIYLCPFSICPAEYDPKDNVMSALVGNQATKNLTLETLLDMYKSKYSFPKYLPHDQMIKFVTEGVQANNMKVKSITSVLKPQNVFQFETKWEELTKLRGNVKPEMAYHGTAEGNIANIVDKGLLVPGKKSGVGHATDEGYWGKGIYLSPNAGLSVGYCRGGKKLLICSVVRGKTYKCQQMMTGGSLKAGYDSHEDPSGNEWFVVLECKLM